MTATSDGHPWRQEDYDLLSVDKLARLQGVQPVQWADDMAPDVFSSDEELEEFLAHVTASRRADVA